MLLLCIPCDTIAGLTFFPRFMQRERPDVVERGCAYPGIDGEVWELWQRACGSYVDYLDALYIVSIRRMRIADTWAYFPEVEVRSPF